MRPREATWLFCVALSATCAAADPAPGADVVRLSIPDCEAVSGAQVEKLVVLELPTNLAVAGEDGPQTTLTASLRCADSRAVITVEDLRRPEPLVLHLDLRETRDEARPRFLALSIAELIATSRLERVAAPAKAQAAPAKVRAAPPPSPGRESMSSLWLAAGVVRANEPATWAPAIGVGVAHDFGQLALTGDVVFDRAERTTALATVSVRSLSSSVAPALRLVTGRFVFRLGLGVRVGYVWLAASPREQSLVGRSLSGAVIVPMLQTAEEIRLSGPLFARLALEAGYVTTTVRGLDADRGALLEARGLRVSALLGAGLSF